MVGCVIEARSLASGELEEALGRGRHRLLYTIDCFASSMNRKYVGRVDLNVTPLHHHSFPCIMSASQIPATTASASLPLGESGVADAVPVVANGGSDERFVKFKKQDWEEFRDEVCN